MDNSFLQINTDPDQTGNYNTPLTPAEEAAFQQWRAQLAASPKTRNLANLQDYDLRGAWKANAQAAGNGHLPDTWKKPNHNTFSDGSIYSGPYTPGGHWSETAPPSPQHPEGRWRFQATDQNLKYRDANALRSYWNEVEQPNGNSLALPVSNALTREASMSTARDIVRRALRLIGVLAAGKVPTGTDASDALEHLQGVVLGLPGLLKNGRWCEVAVSSAYTAREGDRCTVTAPGVVTLPTVITCDGSSRPPRDLTRVQILGADASNAGLWIYSATKAAWTQADALDINSEIPFGPEDDAGLSALLAVEVAAEYGGEAELGQRTIADARIAAASFRSRFKKSEPIDWSRPEPCDPLAIPVSADLGSDYY